MSEKRFSRLLVASVLPLAVLAACGDDAAEGDAGTTADDGREASGEILPSSISDDMIATDRLRSQPPLMVEEPTAAGAGAPAEAGTDGATADMPGEGAPDAATAPAAMPEAEPVPLPND